ncbi:hypothetical protein Avbf_02585 [Armadillidium vulgare]|nr:hypothetical protein Avbf_02585 [Armadillidium vulgare]
MARVVTRLGERTELICGALGDKPIDVLWYFDSRILDPHTDRRMKIRKEPTDEGITSILEISGAARTHTGSYTCNAANAFGRDTRLIELVVQGKNINL